MEERRRRKRSYLEGSERTSGDLLSYFILHNIISVLFFFMLTLGFGIYKTQNLTWAFILSSEFWELTIFNIFPLFVLSAIIGRITAYYIVKGYNTWKKTASKRWSELNKGINKIGIRFLITALFTAFFYSLSVISMLQFVVFDEDTLLTFILIYSGLKIATFYFVRWLVGSKL